MAEDKAEASIACRQVGDIRISTALPRQEEVFSEKTSILFKHQRVVRMVDAKRHALIYLTFHFPPRDYRWLMTDSWNCQSASERADHAGHAHGQATIWAAYLQRVALEAD